MCNAGAGAMAGGLLQMQANDANTEMQVGDINRQKEMNVIKAREAERLGALEAENRGLVTQKTLGAQEAAMGGSGLDVSSGTFNKLKTNTVSAGAQDQQTIMRNAMMQAWGYRAQNFALTNKAEKLSELNTYKNAATFLGAGSKAIG